MVIIKTGMKKQNINSKHIVPILGYDLRQNGVAFHFSRDIWSSYSMTILRVESFQFCIKFQLKHVHSLPGNHTWYMYKKMYSYIDNCINGFVIHVHLIKGFFLCRTKHDIRDPQHMSTMESWTNVYIKSKREFSI